LENKVLKKKYNTRTELKTDLDMETVVKKTEISCILLVQVLRRLIVQNLFILWRL